MSILIDNVKEEPLERKLATRNEGEVMNTKISHSFPPLINYLLCFLPIVLCA